MEPPPCIQNAMLTKDKKPFTYTPGGLNLSEIRSPRMARRIERNAAYEGVGTPPPQSNRNPISPGSLPPSALAAMQPQMHVQVFPSGPPPPPPIHHHNRGSAPPPPPPPPQTSSAPLPPPMQPLPTQKVRTADQQIVERPDMTKIIPDNPMALLKKTGGPRIKNTLLEEMYKNPEVGAQAQMMNNNNNNNQQQRSPPVSQDNSRWQQQPQRSPPSPPQQETQREVYNIPQEYHQAPKNINVGSIYIPPLNKQPNTNVSMSSPIQSPKIQSPGTPTLKEAPRPWQQKHQKQGEDIPEWVRKSSNNNSPSSPAVEEQTREAAVVNHQQQPRWPQPNQQKIQQDQIQESQQYPNQWQQPQRPGDLQQQLNHSPKIIQQKQVNNDVYQNQRQQQPRQMHQVQEPQQQQRQIYQAQQQVDYPQQKRQLDQRNHQGAAYPDPAEHPNAVFVTQPIILHHPGNGYGPPIINRREIMTKQSGGERIIPVMVEAGNDRRNNKENTLTAFGGPQEQMRKLQLNSNNTDQELMNRFKQVPSDAAPAKPQIRNIPIQIEGGNAPAFQTYVPPSQQAPAEEPKKYMGGSIPSRSFRMLQAMTSPDFCANANEVNDLNENLNEIPSGTPWAFPYPPPYQYHPYWPPYYPPFEYFPPPTDQSCSDTEINNLSRRTPTYKGHPPSIIVTDSDQNEDINSRNPTSFSRCSSTSELEYLNSRRTPIPHWSCTTPIPGGRSNNSTPTQKGPYFWRGDNLPQTVDVDEAGCISYYPPFPPYYYPYYYGYPPYYSPLPYLYSNSSDSEDVNGYSSMDEMSYYNTKHSSEVSQSTKEERVPVEPQNKILIPHISLDEADKDISSSSDTDTETGTFEALPKRSSVPGGLQTIKSVADINEYKNSDDESSEEYSDDSNSSNSSVYQGDEIIPHQLSVIFEVSERTDLSRNARACSVASDSTTIGIKSDDEEENLQNNKYWIANNLAEIASRIQSRINARIGLEENDSDHCQNVNSDEDCQENQTLCDNLVDSNNEPIETNHCQIDEEETKIENRKSELVVVEEKIEIYETELEEEPAVASKESSDSEDWWSVIGNKDDDYPVRKPLIILNDNNNTKEESETNQNSNNENTEEGPNVITCDKQIEPDRTTNKNFQEEISSYETDSEDILPEKINLEEENKNNESIKEISSTHSIDLSRVSLKEVSEPNENVNENAVEAEEVYYEEFTLKLPFKLSKKKLQEELTESTSNSKEKEKESKKNIPSVETKEPTDDESSSENEDSETVETEKSKNNEDDEEPTLQVPSIKDRIRALQESVNAKKKVMKIITTEEEEDTKINVVVSSTEPSRSRMASAKSSVKSFDEISEEDSGVTDMSNKHLSDNEDFPELRKMNKYQRASTHSRLFQLLQEECDDDDDDEDEKKTQFTLPLSPNNERLANELVESILQQKKGQIFKNMSMDKLHAAAKRALEENENVDTPSEGFSEFLSPLRTDTGNSTPQELYSQDYKQYYDSWAQASASEGSYYDFIPSKTFKLIQDGKLGKLISSAKCPRVLSSKNVNIDLLKMSTESNETVFPKSDIPGPIS